MAAIVKVPNTLPNLVGGAAGVDIFFVISGFIMVYVSGPLFGSPAGARNFFARRLIRIVPLYWFATTFLIGIYVVLLGRSLESEAITSWDTIATYLFMSTRGGEGSYAPILGAGWTLNYEMFFYALFAIGVILPRRQAVIAVCVTLTAFALLGSHLPAPDSLRYLTEDFRARPMFLEFVIGMLLGWAYVEGWRIPRAVATLVAVAGAAVLIISMVIMAHKGAAETFVAASAVFGFNSPRVLVWGVPSAMLVIGLLFAAEPSAPGRGWRFAALLGDASYALYLLHGPIHLLMRTTFVGFGGWLAQSPLAYTTFLVVIAVAASVAFHAIVERPFTDWLRGLLLNRSQEPRAAATVRG